VVFILGYPPDFDGFVLACANDVVIVVTNNYGCDGFCVGLQGLEAVAAFNIPNFDVFVATATHYIFVV